METPESKSSHPYIPDVKIVLREDRVIYVNKDFFYGYGALWLDISIDDGRYVVNPIWANKSNITEGDVVGTMYKVLEEDNTLICLELVDEAHVGVVDILVERAKDIMKPIDPTY